MEKSGIFSLVSLSEKESEAFLEYLRKSSNSTVFDLLRYISGEEYLKVLDLLAGMVIKVPSRKNIYRDVNQIKIYCYVRDRGYTLSSLKAASRLYSKPMAFVRGAVSRISNIIEGSQAEIINDLEKED